MKDPQAIAAGAFVDTPSARGDGTTYKAPASPVRFPGADDGPKGPSPAMGQHTRDILASLGYSHGEIDKALAAGTVTGAATDERTAR